VSNAALDLGRQRGRREVYSLDALTNDGNSAGHPAAFENAGHGLERADIRRLLNEALKTLSEAQRQTFVLHADGDLSYREVAEIMGISIGTVMSRLFYARQRLRLYLADRVSL
jgi:RNA polymerase sigma-70 factor (ECF subfamily)